jgi:hypothetical protein
MPPLPDDLMNPPMMAIGDSLYQGVRSLSLKGGMPHWSTPAQVARTLGLGFRFNCPDLAKPLVIDMEQWLRMLPDIDAIKADMKANIRYWLPRPRSPSGRPAFENVAIASATVQDLYTDTWAKAHQRVRDMIARLGSKIYEFGDHLGILFQALNTRYTLNPMNKAALADMTQVDLAGLRKPERLLVNIGSNNGLWEICFEANPRARLKLKGEMRQLARRLNALPAETRHIYVNSLGLPSTVANLMPIPDLIEERVHPPAGGYYDNYENRFGFGYGTVSKAQMTRLDAHVNETNQAVRQIFLDSFDDPGRVHFVDMAALLTRYDAKQHGAPPERGVRMADGRRFTNFMLEVTPFFHGFRKGGLFGLDGMHPTMVGYGLMAQQVVDSIAAHEGGAARPVDLEAAYVKDKLLQDLPGIWSLAPWLWRDYRRAQGVDEADPRGEDADRQASLEVMAACCQFKYT